MEICTVSMATGRAIDPVPIGLQDILTVDLVPAWRYAEIQNETVRRLQRALRDAQLTRASRRATFRP